MARHPGDGVGLEQVRAVLNGGAESALGLGQHHHQIELGDSLLQCDRLH
jgi:hypothetical protein